MELQMVPESQLLIIEWKTQHQLHTVLGLPVFAAIESENFNSVRTKESQNGHRALPINHRVKSQLLTTLNFGPDWPLQSRNRKFYFPIRATKVEFLHSLILLKATWTINYNTGSCLQLRLYDLIAYAAWYQLCHWNIMNQSLVRFQRPTQLLNFKKRSYLKVSLFKSFLF